MAVRAQIAVVAILLMLLATASGCSAVAEWAGLVHGPASGRDSRPPAGSSPPGDPQAGPRDADAGSRTPAAGAQAGGGTGGPPASAAAAPPLQRATLLSVGDVLLHDTLLAAGRDPASGDYDFRPAFAHVRDAIRAADLAVANLEEPVAGADLGYSGYPRFNAPDALLAALRDAGFDVLTNANNHSGAKGVTRTYAALDRFGFVHTGTARSAAERDRVAMADVRGIRIAFLAYTYGTNGIPLPEPYMVNLIDGRRIAADIARARAAGADLVSVSLHFGNEYEPVPSPAQERLVDAVLAAGADIVLGHHPHVLQRAELRPATGTGDPGGRGNGEAGQAGGTGEQAAPRSAATAPDAPQGQPAGGGAGEACGPPAPKGRGGAGATAQGTGTIASGPGAAGSGSHASAGGTGVEPPAPAAAGDRPCLYKAVLFSQGNFLAGQVGEDRMTSALFWLDVARDPATGRAGVTGIRYLPLYIHKGRVGDRGVWRPVPAREAALDPARYDVPSADVPLLQRAFHRAVQRLEAPGVRRVDLDDVARRP
ncbi:Capsule synthesis protein, CapA [Thermaerobacter marianensis DSM 12885]|uniref:Capsule synthesis protein, CapA n=1 Tax=Thermaerobacter marianensis (strain ATCC 700841 / DSM 12885 / JCM 10246 / 7p75a) TaxID=644966 RepID=E6SJ42_THEM7|nr:CapA family protein [Thermaerobacter marianensis]ADU52066.1 Capsule synthesis protein, CapA [Thermaerobacter marianensis DSM 12885]